MNSDRQQKVADTLYRGVGQVIQVQRNTFEWFANIPTTQKVIVVGLIALIVFAGIYSLYVRSSLTKQLAFDTSPSFLTNINKLHNTHNAYEYQYINGNSVPFLPAKLFPTYNSHQFTWTFWLFVNGFDPKGNGNDWGSYRFGKWKHVLTHGSGNMEGQQYPGFWLKPTENTLSCTVSTNPGPDLSTHTIVDLENIPMNEWFQVSFVLDEMSVALYMNGQLITTRMLPTPPRFIPNQNVHITNDGGFPGNLFYVQYINSALEPNKIRDMYKEQKVIIDDHIHSLNYNEFVKKEFTVTNLNRENVHTKSRNDISTGGTSGQDKELNTYKAKVSSWI